MRARTGFHLGRSSTWTNPVLPYEQRVGRHAEIVKEPEAAERAREAERLKEIAAHRKRVRQHIIELGEQHMAAMDIRDMVRTLSVHPDLGPQGRSQFDEWVERC
jgi:hypothetical protein